MKNRDALIEAIRNLEDEELIAHMLDLVRAYAREEESGKPTAADWWDELSPEQQRRLDASIASADRGDFIDDDEVMNGF